MFGNGWAGLGRDAGVAQQHDAKEKARDSYVPSGVPSLPLDKAPISELHSFIRYPLVWVKPSRAVNPARWAKLNLASGCCYRMKSLPVPRLVVSSLVEMLPVFIEMASTGALSTNGIKIFHRFSSSALCPRFTAPKRVNQLVNQASGSFQRVNLSICQSILKRPVHPPSPPW